MLKLSCYISAIIFAFLLAILIMIGRIYIRLDEHDKEILGLKTNQWSARNMAIGNDIFPIEDVLRELLNYLKLKVVWIRPQMIKTKIKIIPVVPSKTKIVPNEEIQDD